MKKLLVFIAILTASITVFGQYTTDKKPTQLDVTTTVAGADFTIMQKSGAKVTAVRMDTLKSYFSSAIISEIESLDSVSGSTGQFIISDGSGWLAPASAIYEGDGAYTFGYRKNVVGWGSFVLNGYPTASAKNEASGVVSFATGIGTTASGEASFSCGSLSTASGDRSFAGNASTASGESSFAMTSGIASGDYSTAWNESTADGNNSTAWNKSQANGNFSTACNSGTAYGNSSIACSGGTTNGQTSIACGVGMFANSFGEIAIGLYNDTVPAISATMWNADDRIFTVGNGNAITPSNALIILKNGNTTATGDWTIDGNLEVTGNISTSVGARVGAYIPEDSTLSQTVATGIWEFMGNGDNNKFVNIYTNSFGFTGDTLTYTGNDSIFVHIEWGGTVSSNVINTDVDVVIYINDVVQPQFQTSTRTATAEELYPLAGCSNIAMLPPNATVKIYVRANKNCTLTFPYFPVALHQIR